MRSGEIELCQTDLLSLQSLLVCTNAEFPAKVARPHYSVLENRALNQLGLNKFRPWQEALATYLASSPALCETNA